MATINLDTNLLQDQELSLPLRFFKWVKKVSESAFTDLSLFIAPLLPAVLFGLSVGKYMHVLYGMFIGIGVGFAAGFSIESAGYNSFKAAQKEQSPRKAAAYLLVGVIVTVVLEFHDLKRMFIGLSGFAIVAIVYWSMSTIDEAQKDENFNDLEKALKLEQDIKDREAKREETKKDREAKRQKIKVNTSEQRSDWRSLSVQDIAQLPFMETNEITEKYGCPSGTARRWRAKARKMNAKANGETNGK